MDININRMGEEIKTQNFYIYSINEGIIQTQKFLPFHNWINKLFSAENKVPRTLFKVRKVAGSATYEQSKPL